MRTDADFESVISNRVLIVDSDMTSCQKRARTLEIMGLGVSRAGSAEEALALLELSPVDLVLFELPVPDMGDPELLHQARQMSSEMLIIVHSSRPTIESTVAAIKVGATDYLIGLVDSKQVINAITCALRQSARERERENERLSQQVEAFLESKGLTQGATVDELPSEGQLLACGPFLLNRYARQLAIRDRSGAIVELTKGEVDVLAALMRRPGVALSCHEIVRTAFRYEVEEFDAQSVVRPYISRLRRKFDDAGLDRHLINTVRGRGYMFVKET